MSDDRVTNYTSVSYDTYNGELTIVDEMLGKQTRDIMRVRAELVNEVLRQACIYELEKLGYTVLSPEPATGDTE